MTLCKITHPNKCANTKSGHQGAFISVKDHCAKKSNPVEMQFYVDADQQNIPLLKVMPKFYQICMHHREPRIEIENVKKNMTKPMSIDIKLGKYTAYVDELQLAGDSLTHAVVKTSKMRIVDAITTSNDEHFRIVGGNGINTLTKQDILTLNPTDVLKSFVSDADVIKSIIKQLYDIHNALKRTQRICLVGASVFIVYDKTDMKRVNVRLIDFAHSHIGKSHESKKYCMSGLLNLIKHFRKISKR